MLRPLAQTEIGPGIRAERLELVSRGDVVNGWLARAETPRAKSAKSRSALVLVVHDAGRSAASAGLGIAGRWVGPELSLVSIDLPLHGHRASPKLSERLLAGLAQAGRGETLDRNGEVLVEEFMRQAKADLVRTLDAVLALPGLDSKRVGLLGIGLGAALVDAWLAQDGRARAAVLVRPPNSHAASPLRTDSPSACEDRSPAAPPSRNGSARAERLVIQAESDPGSWEPAARAFLEARLR